MKIRFNFKKLFMIGAVSSLTLITPVKAQTLYVKGNSVEQASDKISDLSKNAVDSSSISEYFAEAKEDITSYFESEDWQKLQKKGKNIITTGIDFIFFDEPINDIYFDDLTEEGKKTVLSAINTTIDYVYNLKPSLFNNLGEKYQVAKSFVSEKYLDAIDSIKDYLGDENYEALIDIKNRLKDTASEYAQKASDEIEDLSLSLKKKYQEWKSK